MTRTVAATVVGILTLALSACGTAEQAGRGSATFSGPTTTTAPATTAPTKARTSPMPSTSTGPPGDRTVPPTLSGGSSRVRVKGTVSEGVEPGCTLLTSNGVVYLLIWARTTPVSGPEGEVEVEGILQPDLMTTCQQGTPLVVERVLSR